MKLPFKDKHLDEIKRVILNGARTTWTIEEKFRQELMAWAREEGDGRRSTTETTKLPTKSKNLQS